MDMILIINKPLNWTSMDVIRKVRGKLKIKKVGHAGTLDPLATGVLIVCTGKNTKKINEFMDLHKEYIATIDLAYVSTTDDGEGEITPARIESIPTKETVLETLKQFTGEISQTPSKFSAIKIQGRTAYERARKNEEFTMPSRQVTVHSIELLDYTWPICKIKVSCSKGTYIRTLAKDIGSTLNVGGYLIGLERAAIGDYTIDQSIELETFLKSDISSE